MSLLLIRLGGAAVAYGAWMGAIYPAGGFFERPCDDGFISARCELPIYTWTPWEGHFTSDELEAFNRFLKANAHLIYRCARGGMALVA